MMVAVYKICMLLGGSYALQSETMHHLATDRGIIGQKEVAKIGAGLTAFAGIRAGANAIGASTSSGISHSSSDDDDGGSRQCHSLIFQAM